VNFLSELVPGARQLRTPLAVGFLWLLVAWINAPRIPDHIRHSLLVGRAIRDASDLTPVLLVFAVSFGAYLLGLVFEILDEAIVKILVVALPPVLLVTLLLLLIGLWPITLPIAIIITSAAIWRRRHQRQLIPELMQRLISIALPLMDYAYWLWGVAQRVWSAARPRKIN